MSNLSLSFDNTYQKNGSQFFATVKPTPLTKAASLIFSKDALRQIHVEEDQIESLRLWLQGEARLPGDQSISQVYGGHQFGVWAGQLGDGRAISLGEILGTHDQRWEVQLKGSGLTPFSRFGDGKAVIRSSIREFLASEALHYLGVPTTRALAVFTGHGNVQRESNEKEALCVRLIQSNVRFGTFEWFASQGDLKSLKQLKQYCQQVLYPEIPEKDLFREVTRRTAEMVAHWQSLGFCHGVMNTDNMSILGVTLDYGPFGFLENTDLEHICNHSDPRGRYRFSQQPAIALWNLNRLAMVFDYLEADQKPDYQQSLTQNFQHDFLSKYFSLMGVKLGVNPKKAESTSPQTEDFQNLVSELILNMDQKRLDWTSTFHLFSKTENEEQLSSLFGNDWLAKYLKLKTMNPINPVYVLKNSVAEKAIRAVEDNNDSQPLKQIFEVLQKPFDVQENMQWWSQPRLPSEPELIVSCSS